MIVWNTYSELWLYQLAMWVEAIFSQLLFFNFTLLFQLHNPCHRLFYKLNTFFFHNRAQNKSPTKWTQYLEYRKISYKLMANINLPLKSLNISLLLDTTLCSRNMFSSSLWWNMHGEFNYLATITTKTKTKHTPGSNDKRHKMTGKHH